MSRYEMYQDDPYGLMPYDIECARFMLAESGGWNVNSLKVNGKRSPSHIRSNRIPNGRRNRRHKHSRLESPHAGKSKTK